VSNELTPADFNQIWDGLNKLHVDLMLRQIKAVHAKNVNGAHQCKNKLKKVEALLTLMERDYGHLRRGTKK